MRIVLSCIFRSSILCGEYLRLFVCLDGGLIFSRWQDHSRLFIKSGIIRCTETLLDNAATGGTASWKILDCSRPSIACRKSRPINPIPFPGRPSSVPASGEAGMDGEVYEELLCQKRYEQIISRRCTSLRTLGRSGRTCYGKRRRSR